MTDDAASALRGTEQVAAGPEGRRPIRRALLSVYDKTGLEELARGLHEAGVELVSTGSTAAQVASVGIPVTAVEQVTGFPEVLGGRVKTLHPGVHAGLLADMTDPEHAATLEQLDIAPFDLLVSNLYPFRETVLSGAKASEIIEQIDVGGPAMVRAAAKNHANVAVVVSPADYAEVLDAARGGGFDLSRRKRLAARAYAHTAAYDVAVATWFASVYAPADDAPYPDFLGAVFSRAAVLRYGENPHQQAALYRNEDHRPGLARAEQIHGKPMSYNNYVDADAARRAAFDHDEPCVAIIKHTNPCGIAIGRDVGEAHRKAHACDPVSAFGGVVAANRTVTAEMAGQLAEIFTEVVVAPDFAPAAIDILTRKASIRLMRCPGPHPGRRLEWRSLSGGVLLQTADTIEADGDASEEWHLACGEPADAATMADLEFAWRACRAVKSNAIVLVAAGATVGVGMGQVNRVDSARLAVSRAKERAAGSVAASDAFFPFADGLRVLLDAGVRAVVQPGGSVRDAEVVAAAADAGLTMYLTGARHFFH